MSITSQSFLLTFHFWELFSLVCCFVCSKNTYHEIYLLNQILNCVPPFCQPQALCCTADHENSFTQLKLCTTEQRMFLHSKGLSG